METVDLSIGAPEDAILPLDAFRAAALHRLSQPSKCCLQYGPEQGASSFRDGLARFLSRQYGTAVSANRLLITAGASHAFDLILKKLTAPGDVVYVEDPTYFLALDILRDRGLTLVPIPTDDDGMDVAELERHLRHSRPALVYTIPAFQNPTGTILSESRRRRLVELANEYDFLVVADEVYHLLATECAIAPLSSYDPYRVLSLGSFSKIFGPGLRIGWIECNPEHIGLLVSCGMLKSGGGVSPVTSAILESALELHIQDQCLKDLQLLYDRRRRFMIQYLKYALPAPAYFLPPRGGYFVWVSLPAGVDLASLRAEALTRHIDFTPGPLFSCCGHFQNCLRLCYTFYDESRLAFACQQLKLLLDRHLATCALPQ